MKNWKVLLALICVGYGAIYFLLFHSNEPEPTLAAKKEVIQEMAAYVETTHDAEKLKDQKAFPAPAKRSNAYHPDARPIEVGGLEMNDQLKEQVSTPEGIAELKKHLGDRAEQMVPDIEAAFQHDQFRSAEEQTTLLDLTHAIADITQSPVLTGRLASEARRYLAPSVDQDKNYGGRALQFYLATEPDPEKRTQFVRSLHPESPENQN
jgi:hypothetical protein